MALVAVGRDTAALRDGEIGIDLEDLAPPSPRRFRLAKAAEAGSKQERGGIGLRFQRQAFLQHRATLDVVAQHIVGERGQMEKHGGIERVEPHRRLEISEGFLGAAQIHDRGADRRMGVVEIGVDGDGALRGHDRVFQSAGERES